MPAKRKRSEPDSDSEGAVDETECEQRILSPLITPTFTTRIKRIDDLPAAEKAKRVAFCSQYVPGGAKHSDCSRMVFMGEVRFCDPWRNLGVWCLPDESPPPWRKRKTPRAFWFSLGYFANGTHIGGTAWFDKVVAQTFLADLSRQLLREPGSQDQWSGRDGRPLLFMHNREGPRRGEALKAFVSNLSSPVDVLEDWPPYSADLSPIWSMALWLTSQLSALLPRTMEDLQQEVHRLLKSKAADKEAKRLLDLFTKRCQVCVAMKGEDTFPAKLEDEPKKAKPAATSRAKSGRGAR